ncbi:methyltransferase domain-containing protein [Methylobacter sp.]|uniref:methyltransferase domain-containing protein n=1 Tax=Methylobacter sp. TaxID=2051955 RepID=UPI003DA2A9CD
MPKFKGPVDVDYLKKAGEIFAPIKQISYKKMQIKQGDTVLDLGCGPGVDAIELGKLVSPDGLVIGVDYDDAMLAEALEQVETLKMSRIVGFQQGDAGSLAFADNYFDSCRSERLFMHLNNPEQVIGEVRRVTKPGGSVVIIDTDWASLSIDCQSVKIERLLSNYRLEKLIPNSYSGRSLYRLFSRAYFSDIQIDVFPLYTNDLELFYTLSLQESVENKALSDNIITQKELEQWRMELKQAALENSFYCSVNMIMVSGIKPFS